MKNYKHIRLFYIAAGISLAVLLTFGVIYLERSRDQVRYINIVEHTYEVLSTLNFCEKNLLEADANQMGFLITGESNYKAHCEVTFPKIDSSLKKIGFLTADNPNQKIHFLQLSKFIEMEIQVLKQNLRLQHSAPQYYERLRSGVVVMEDCQYYMSKMRRVEEALLKERVDAKNKYQQLNLFYFRALLIIACLVCTIALAIFFRELGIRISTQKSLKDNINELTNSKKELEEITYAVSHDMQEPMRKVQVLSSMIVKKFSTKLPDEGVEIVNRMNNVTKQMYELLNDLISYTNMLNPNKTFVNINLNTAFSDAYNRVFSNEPVHFQIDAMLPEIYGSLNQVETMLLHLFDNCRKYKDQARPLEITIKYELTKIKEANRGWDFTPPKKYHKITISDNGIGFDVQYNDKIFELFKRLDSNGDKPGKGIGLSVARRVMLNHKGFILVTGQNVGAGFSLYFPLKDL